MITRRRREITWSHVARIVSLSIFAQDSFNFFFNFSTFECDTAQSFLSKMDHIPKSIELRSREEGGQSSFDQKDLSCPCTRLELFWLCERLPHPAVVSLLDFQAMNLSMEEPCSSTCPGNVLVDFYAIFDKNHYLTKIYKYFRNLSKN